MIETIGRIYVIDNGEVAIEWIHEKNPLFGNKSEYYISHSHTGDTLATFKTRKALVASYEAAQELSTLLEIREMLITKTYLSRLGSAKSPKKATASRANGAKGGRPVKRVQLLNPWSGAMPEDKNLAWAEIRAWAQGHVHPDDLPGWLRRARQAFRDNDGAALGTMIIGS